jgi:signal transduction histidine kinase
VTATDRAELTIEGLIHDLQNVFQTIGESAELLQEDPKWARIAATLQRTVHHGQRLVNSIRENKRSSANAASVISSAVQFARDYLECVHGPEIEVSQDIEPDLQLPGDPAAWERVLVNLLVNAAEAGAKHVHLLACPDEVVVRDDGHGISPELLPHIFQPHVSTKAILSGLGLYVVQSIVEQHGGTVTASNLHGGGAEFRMRLSAPE